MAKTKQPRQSKYADRYPGGVPLHTSDMYQWSKVGQELVGEFVGIKVYKKGHIANVRTEDGVIAFSAPTVLAGILQGVRPGSRIAIVFSGEEPPAKRGQNGVKLFEVYGLNEEEEQQDEEEGEDEE